MQAPDLVFSYGLQLEKLVSKDTVHYDIICFHYYIQYHLYLQVSKNNCELYVNCICFGKSWLNTCYMKL